MRAFFRNFIKNFNHSLLIKTGQILAIGANFSKVTGVNSYNYNSTPINERHIRDVTEFMGGLVTDLEDTQFIETRRYFGTDGGFIRIDPNGYSSFTGKNYYGQYGLSLDNSEQALTSVPLFYRGWKIAQTDQLDYNAFISIPDPETIQNFVFKGWSESENGIIRLVPGGLASMRMPARNLVLYAIYEANVN